MRVVRLRHDGFPAGTAASHVAPDNADDTDQRSGAPLKHLDIASGIAQRNSCHKTGLRAADTTIARNASGLTSEPLREEQPSDKSSTGIWLRK